MRSKFLVIMLFLSCFRLTEGQEISEIALPTDSSVGNLFKTGNQAYIEDNYHKSIDCYRAVLDKGQESYELHYNLGNAYFKTGDIIRAILHYEKAKKLNSGDEDLLTNLELANLKTIDKVESKPELMIEGWWNNLLNAHTIDEWGKYSIYLSFLAFLIMILYLFGRGLLKKIAFFAAMAAFALSAIYYFLGYQQKSLQTAGRYAIVFAPTVTVKSAPEDDGTKLFVIHEGTKLKIQENLGDWAHISLMNGSKGWVKISDYEEI